MNAPELISGGAMLRNIAPPEYKFLQCYTKALHFAELPFAKSTYDINIF